MRQSTGLEQTTKMPSGITSIANWKNLIIALIIVFGGGGGLAALDFMTQEEVEECVDGKLVNERLREDTRHRQIDAVVQQQGSDLVVIKTKVDDIQTVQRKQIARQEARRLTSAIRDRREREAAYDRLLDLNLRRLHSGQDPCRTIACEN